MTIKKLFIITAVLFSVSVAHGQTPIPPVLPPTPAPATVVVDKTTIVTTTNQPQPTPVPTVIIKPVPTTLPNTGGKVWILPVIGFLMVAAGLFGMRKLNARN
jgi:LPXTG-motif cell wall-anchored protein